MKRSLVLSLIMVFSISLNNFSVANAEVNKVANSDKSITSQYKVCNYDEIAKSIHEQAEVLVKTYGEVSVQYAISDNNKIVISDNVGKYSKTSDKELTKDSMYGIGSISKMFVTASVMKLVDEGKINLDTPVVEYIPEFKMQDERYKNITVRMLLNHSSGIMGTMNNGGLLMNDNDRSVHNKFLKQLETERLKAEPGEFSVYSNDGFSLAEIVVERVSNLDFSTYIKENFSDKLDLKNTKTPVDEFDRENLVKTYFGDSSLEKKTENVNLIGAGGIYSTAEELCKFIDGISTENKILSKQSIEMMRNNEYEKGTWNNDSSDNMVAYGLGWDSVNLFPFNRYNIKALSKGGDTISYHSAVINLPEYNLTVSVLSSDGASIYNELFATRIMLQVLKEKGIISEIKPDIKLENDKTVDMPKEYTKYSGIYGSYSGTFTIEVDPKGQLTLRVLGGTEDQKQVYNYVDNGYFATQDGSERVYFEEKNGITYLAQKQYVSLEGLSQIASCDYQLQKLDDNKITDNVKKAWEKRNNKSYFVVNRKYTDDTYNVQCPSFKLVLDDKAPGYALGDKIVDENKCETTIKIPGSNGRDLFDYDFYKENNVEYIKARSIVVMSEDGISNLSDKLTEVKIEDNGYAKWYKVGEDMNGKTLKVDLPEKGAFIVYDANNALVMNSYLEGKNTVTLSSGQLIVFAGDKGQVFKTNMQ